MNNLVEMSFLYLKTFVWSVPRSEVWQRYRMSNAYEYSQMCIDRDLNIYLKVTHISMSNIFSQIGLHWSNSSLCSHQQDTGEPTHATLPTNSISSLWFFFSHLMVKDIHLSKKRYCNPNHCCANKKQLVKIVWFPAGNLCSVHLRGAILTWWAVKLLPGARMRGT